MVIKYIKDLKLVCRIGMSWMIIFIFGLIVMGLVGVVYVYKFGVVVSDFEMIFIIFFKILFYLLIIGFLLFVILVVIMSLIFF